MNEIEFDQSQCENCGQHLFLSKEECASFIEKKLKEGYMICWNCGAKPTTAPGRKPKKKE